MNTVTNIQENAEDIYADAKDINDDREAKKQAALIDDEESEQDTEAVEE